MRVSQSLDIGEEKDKKDAKEQEETAKQATEAEENVKIKPTTQEKVKAYHDAHTELESIPKVDFEKGKQPEAPKKELPGFVYAILLIVIVAALIWALYEPVTAPAVQKNATQLAQILETGLV
ncbi:MAG: hypothetical protein QF486_03540 [Candidatus Woesearchaeota archaeon]|jgi:hypothetical protein|nr:hypothetical protein [Candidatus Woesearchaeota archaeon]MDP7182067.1 hypothetical protein [Candidatus Woesearchaeota archaeon]MDP7198669.1 hypothetical protein [Candidatus Woesearchaeota archaeon]MDP7467643.1 hypothetical protein [Candidatus Woesearchaeota archaeon]MDP7647139.1 hypothetical protein [Candidatus Woesearchaeota archaeon]|tara:strand:- start:99 stop:464 length:366 start_codon:yes stop_codon:yes gene_type:complete